MRFSGPIFRREFDLLYPGSVRIVIKPSIFALSVVFALSSLFVQKPGWHPSSGHTQIPIWPGSVPDAQFGPPPNTEMVPEPGEVDNVSRPTMMVYPPTGKNTGAAVVVFPGGGYYVLAIDLEGTEVCDWLTSKGITCVLLKYRVPYSGPQWDERCKCQRNPKAPMALEDAQRTVGLVRFHAAEYHIDPHKIGVLGILGRRAPGSRYQHALRQTFVSDCRCGRQRKLPPGFRSGPLSGASLVQEV